MSAFRSRPPRWSRRAVSALIVQAATLWASRLAAQGLVGSDRGIGGTGVQPTDPTETLGQDRGIGGTGVIGTIKGFGSIVVNDLHVTYPPAVRVTIDGVPAAARDLKIGHVVHVLARRRKGVLVTQAIVAVSEVIGVVEAVTARTLVVLDQQIGLQAELPDTAVAIGDVVAVSGLRRPDGTIVASLVERRQPGPSMLRGPVRLDPLGALRIGPLRLIGLNETLAGRRVALSGHKIEAQFHAESAVVEPATPFAAANLLSIEGYMARDVDRLRFGSGLDVALDQTAVALEAGETVRAVVTAVPSPGGGLRLESFRLDHGTRGSGRGASPPGTQGAPNGPGEGPLGGPNMGPGHGVGPGGGGPGGGGPGGGGPGGGGPGGGGPGGSGPGGGTPVH